MVRAIRASASSAPRVWCLGDQPGRLGQRVRAQLLEGAGQVRELQVEVFADRPAQHHALGGLGVGVGLGAVALLARLGLGLVEISVAEVPEEPCSRRLRDARKGRQFGCGVGFHQRMILEQESGQFLLSFGETGTLLLDSEG